MQQAGPSRQVLSRDTNADDLSQQLSSLSIAPAKLHVLISESCLLHKFARRDESGQLKGSDDIVERPERISAVKLGIAAAYCRLDPSISLPAFSSDHTTLKLQGGPFDIRFVKSSLSLLHDSVRYVHNKSNLAPSQPEDINNLLPLYPEQLLSWIKNSAQAHEEGKSEIPLHLPQGDLYLSPGSKDAIEGSIGCVCQAVEEVAESGGSRFCVVRPPGHHCGHDSPCGFCFVNLAAIAAAHAHLTSDIDRIVIFDIDLHHGQGTQEIVWRINQEAQSAGSASPIRNNTPRTSPAKVNGASPTNRRTPLKKRKRPLKMLYASLHDVLSYPCEDGDPRIVADASVRLSGAHGQYISNVHLEPYSSVQQFHSEIYPTYHEGLFGAAKDFLSKSTADPERTLFLVSAGMDASEHEYPSMSRHNRRVPTSFYSRFGRDLNAFASSPTSYSPRPTSTTPVLPKIVAVLEGGYSDRALASATASFLAGLASDSPFEWDLVKDIIPLEKACATTVSTTAASKKPLPEYLVQTGLLWDLLTGQQRQKSDWQLGIATIPILISTQPAMKLRDRTRLKSPQPADEVSSVAPAPIRRKKKVEPVTEDAEVQNGATLASSTEEEKETPILAPSIPPIVFAAPTRPLTALEALTGAGLLDEDVSVKSGQQEEQGTEPVKPVQALKLVWRSQGIQ